MKKFLMILMILVFILTPVFAEGSSERSDVKDKRTVENQQQIYQSVLPVPMYDYSIPRDVFIQIYNTVTTRAYMTYSIITSMTGELIYEGASVGYALPADMQLTNPVKKYYEVTLEQAEPNGLFSSKNTDGTWVLFVQPDGSIAPVYTEMKVTTFPYEVMRPEAGGGWTRTDDKPVDFTIDLN